MGQAIDSWFLLSESVLPMGPVDFEIFTSIRSDVVLKDSRFNTSLSDTGEPSQFYMLRYHRDRLLSAAKQFNFTEAIKFLSGSESAHILELELLEYLLHEFGSSSYLEPLKVPSGSTCCLMRDIKLSLVLLNPDLSS